MANFGQLWHRKWNAIRVDEIHPCPYKLQSSFNARKRRMKSRTLGFTLVELLVVIAIIGILVGMLLPAVQAAREAARRASCSNNMIQIAMAVHQYEQSFRILPAGVVNATGPISNFPIGYHHNWICAILPYLDQPATNKLLDRKQSVYALANVPVRSHRISLLRCSSSPVDQSVSDYAGVHHEVEAPIDQDNHGVFFLNSFLPTRDIEDGVSHTAMLIEKVGDFQDLGWSSGTRASLRNLGSITPGGRLNRTAINLPGIVYASDNESDETVERRVRLVLSNELPEAWIDLKEFSAPAGIKPEFYVGGGSSYHGSGVNMVFADGTVRFTSHSIDETILFHLGHRKDGRLPPRLEQ
jgi:prepilin-type N-terminal cleavage/methylation domain-containing protein/prepilin-type processing-associated H-X9-DG protein